MAEINEAVLQAIEEHALTPEAVERVIALTERDNLRERQDALERELATLERQIHRLSDTRRNGLKRNQRIVGRDQSTHSSRLLARPKCRVVFYWWPETLTSCPRCECPLPTSQK